MQVNTTMFCDWLADTVGAKNAVVRELEDESVVVEFEFYPDRPFVGKYKRVGFHLNREGIEKFGLLTVLLALAAHVRDVQKDYEEQRKGVK